MTDTRRYPVFVNAQGLSSLLAEVPASDDAEALRLAAKEVKDEAARHGLDPSTQITILRPEADGGEVGTFAAAELYERAGL